MDKFFSVLAVIVILCLLITLILFSRMENQIQAQNKMTANNACLPGFMVTFQSNPENENQFLIVCKHSERDYTVKFLEK